MKSITTLPAVRLLTRNQVASGAAFALSALALAGSLSPVSAQTTSSTPGSNAAGEGSSPQGPAPGTGSPGGNSGVNTATNAANNAVSGTPAPPATVTPPTTVPAVAPPQNPTPNPSIPVPSANGQRPAPIAPATLPPQTTYNLAQTVRLALSSSSDLQIATTNLQRDAAAVQVARSQDLPRINTQDTYQHLDSPIRVPFAIPGQPPTFITAETQDKEILTLNGTLPLDISGRIRATVQQAQLQQLADRFNRDRVYNNRVLYAQQTYFNLLRAQHQVDVNRSAVENAVAQETIAQRQFAGGVGQRIDYLRAQSQVATAQQNLFAAENNLSNEQNTFNDLVSRPLGQRVTAVDAPGVTTGTAVSSNVAAASNVTNNAAAAAAEVQVPPVSSFFTPDTNPPVSLEEGLRRAKRQRPELLADQVNVQAADRQVQITRTGNYPTLTLNASGDYYPVTDFQTPRHSLGVYTVQLNIPLYDAGETAARVREARASEANTKTLYGSDQTEVELQVRQNYSNLLTAAQQISAANVALQEAIAARELAQVRYANGIGLYLEVTDAENALTQAETNQVNAVYNYLTARAQYENAIGAPQIGSTI